MHFRPATLSRTLGAAACAGLFAIAATPALAATFKVSGELVMTDPLFGASPFSFEFVAFFDVADRNAPFRATQPADLLNPDPVSYNGADLTPDDVLVRFDNAGYIGPDGGVVVSLGFIAPIGGLSHFTNDILVNFLDESVGLSDAPFTLGADSISSASFAMEGVLGIQQPDSVAGSFVTIAAVPLPATAALLAGGLAVFAAAGRRKRG